ncbi:hypothetical protein [Hymenobacter sp. CRA2]|uniref:hypothetical protein n=1 Tax=Hymenobacter sp. CRA2 TaxID=1955620 RepID=UPI00098F5B7D|nr:hypothetical protein [Hymenobacter sp. CRA2]OON69956.1 hypothetical protein B0919_04195 [Hymenobacter sp. CRA2]
MKAPLPSPRRRAAAERAATSPRFPGCTAYPPSGKQHLFRPDEPTPLDDLLTEAEGLARNAHLLGPYAGSF